MTIAPPDTTTEATLDQTLAAAEQAAVVYRRWDRSARARLLRTIADALDAAGDRLVPIAQEETHLAEGRLSGELTRTTFQLRLFAETIDNGDYLGARVDEADPDWPMGAARPDLRRIMRPLGPVLVFSASNFPFAFSTAGGDTASALAAGCPVVVKAHRGHPRLTEATAEAVQKACAEAGAPEGMFAVIFGTESGRIAVQDPRIKAAGFTGSIGGGRALFDLANSRPDPIPFYGELGSNNPVFVTGAADSERGVEIADEFVGSFTMGAGQFCTKPGTILVPVGSRLLERLREVTLPPGAAMLNEGIRDGYVAEIEKLQSNGAEVVNAGAGPFSETAPDPIIHRVEAAEALGRPDDLLGECFGPSTLVIEYTDESQLLELARAYTGQLTASLQAQGHETVLPDLLDTLAEVAGRLLFNQWPTGVSVTYAQQHGGPYPASTAGGSTSVGTAAIERFLRPVAYQGMPEHLLPAELVAGAGVAQMINGRR
ncbi:aldehyde dehydrogenase (NADP(+)) [Brevibacterium marinum]|uniref:NADP-dependent aldehyde dehydrogenase n=1 Tax=Brevibacterium marinum TaxID=418643 RepID=A0A846RM89_9MICO|nr:aldehyde dehydrogenase (NADP(+)) [Brevibacterium marinum]NJC54974.1 NADP-dependent aldehyde dehydrogenase [Brevibacterium marinum]